MTSLLQKLSAAAILVAATAIVPACAPKTDTAAMDKMSADVASAKAAAESAAKSAAQAADAAKAAQQAAEQASMTASHTTGKHMRNK